MRARATALLLGLALAGVAWGDMDIAKVTGIYADPSAGPLEKQAASVLCAKLNRIYGVKLTVNPSSVPYASTLRNAVFIGKKAALESGLVAAEEMEKVKYDGFVIRVKEDRAAIAGATDRSSIYGAYAFLEMLGYRFYKSACETFPKPATSVIKDVVVSDKPAIPFRSGSSWELRQSVNDIADPRKGATPELFGKDSNLWLDHTGGYLVPRKLYFAAHPEYFSTQLDGTRNPTKTSDAYVHLCLSNPEVTRISIERAVVWARNEPDKRFFCITQGDGHDWCQCAQCKAMDVAPGNYSDRLLKWVNPIARAIAEVRPDAVVLMGAYCGTERAPVKERPEKNAYVMYCPYWGLALSAAHPLTDESNSDALKEFEGWRKVAPDNIAIYDYNIGYVPSWDAMSEKVRWYARQGVKGIWHCGRPICFSDLFTYMTAKLEWNPNQDPETLKREFVEAVYGPAALHAMEYLALVRDRLTQGYPKGMHEESMPPAFYEANALNRMLSCFDKAEAAAGTDAALQKNLRRERDLMMADYRAAVTLKTPGLKGADRELAMKLFRDYAGEQRAKYEDLSKALSQEGLAAGKKEALQKERDTLTAALRQALNRFGCMGVPQDTDLLPALELFVKDPEAARAKYPVKTVKTDAEKIPGGIRLPATAFAGGFGPDLYGWFCPPKTGMAIYAPRSPRPSQMKTEFTLDAAPAGAAVLDIEGQDSQNDLPPPAQIEITLNGKKIHAGDCGFVKRGWSRRQFPIPAGALQKGKNVLEIRNITPETKRLDGWWFFLSEAAIKFEK